ncbi:MAG: InlB B-repeat-containing protein [Clostridiales bacterium]|nr:InlB B-repeat-containing protein [Clostridiales bacterium]
MVREGFVIQKTVIKKLSAAMLALALMIPMVSAGALADETKTADEIEVSFEAELRVAVGSVPDFEPVTIRLADSIELTGGPLVIASSKDIRLAGGAAGAAVLEGAESQDVIVVQGGAKLTIGDGIVVSHGGGSSKIGRGVSVSSGGLLTMAGGAVSGNSSIYYGGGVYSDGDVAMIGGEISGNTAANGLGSSGAGGGIYINKGSFTMEGGKVSGNTAASNGGGVFITAKGTFVMKGGEISGNTGNSGGVRNDGGFTLSGGEITGNTGLLFGGGVYNSGNTVFTMDGGEISGNTAPQGGGVYNVGNQAFRMEGGRIAGNKVTLFGGGVYNGGSSFFAMAGGEVSGNEAAEGGGGVINNGVFEMIAGDAEKRPAILGNTVTGTTASGMGGGVYNTGAGKFVMENGVVSGNTAIQGGGVHNNKSGAATIAEFLMKSGEISENRAADGGGVYSSGVFTMEDGAIRGNIADNDGGGVFCSYADLRLLGVWQDAEFSNNAARKAYSRNPADDELYEEQIKCTAWTAPLVQGYNNYDISYVYEADDNAVTVFFDGNGGTVLPEDASRTTSPGTSLGAEMPAEATRGGYIFNGWNTAANGSGNSFTSQTIVISDITVYAIWSSGGSGEKDKNGNGTKSRPDPSEPPPTAALTNEPVPAAGVPYRGHSQTYATEGLTPLVDIPVTGVGCAWPFFAFAAASLFALIAARGKRKEAQ